MGEASAEASARTTDFFFLHPLLSFPTSDDHMANITVNVMNPNAKWLEKLIFSICDVGLAF